jgi:LacI family gluconate utilization system Gnt-I transcriptional repressor
LRNHLVKQPGENPGSAWAGDREQAKVRKPDKERRPTLKDVAALAGVSPITVSRALRQPRLVSESLRERIATSIREIDYTPDPNASALASARTNVLAVMIPSLTNAVFADVMRGVYDAAEHTAYQVQIANTRYSPIEEERMLRIFLSQRPVALIMTGIDQTHGSRELMVRSGRPIVQIMETTDEPVDMTVGFSHYEAGRAITLHMLAAGYRRIGFLGARLDPRSLRRIKGYKDVLQAEGLAEDSLLAVTHAPSSIALGRDLFRDLLARRPDIDAVMCVNDDVALGALFECQRAGVAVPGRIGIAGFNDLEGAEIAYPALTTVRTPRYQIGRKAVEMAIAAVEGAEIPERRVDLGFQVKARESTRG